MENWRDIPGYEGRYMVSDQGRVRSLVTNRILRAPVPAKGYARVTLTDAQHRHWVPAVHRLVLETFIGPKPVDLVTRHLDGDRANNRLSNLCYGTYEENWEDRELHGNGEKGEKNPNCRLSDDQVSAIRSHFMTNPYKRGMYSEVARKYAVSSRLISYLVYNKLRPN
jgi:hypothetical protein